MPKGERVVTPKKVEAKVEKPSAAPAQQAPRDGIEAGGAAPKPVPRATHVDITQGAPLSKQAAQAVSGNAGFELQGLWTHLEGLKTPKARAEFVAALKAEGVTLEDMAVYLGRFHPADAVFKLLSPMVEKGDRERFGWEITDRIGADAATHEGRGVGLPFDSQINTHAKRYDKALRDVLARPEDPAAQRAWAQAQKDTEADLGAYKAYFETLPKDSPERARAEEKLSAMRWQYRKIDAHLQAHSLAGEEPWKAMYAEAADPNSVLSKRLRLSGLTMADLEVYFTTGELTPAMQKARAAYQRHGDYPQLGIMHTANTLLAAGLRKRADAAQGDDKTKLETAAVAIEEDVRRMPTTARGIRLNHAKRLEVAADDKAAAGNLSADEQKKVEDRRQQALEIYQDVGNHYKKKYGDKLLTLDKKHPAVVQTTTALEGEARVTRTVALDKYNRADKAYSDHVASVAPLPPLLPPPVPPPVLARETRDPAQIKADATKEAHGTRPLEAIYNEIAVLNPTRAAEPDFRETQRGIKALRLDLNVTYKQRLYPEPKQEKGQPQKPSPIPDQKLMDEIALDGHSLLVDVEKRERELTIKGLDDKQRAEYGELETKQAALAKIPEDKLTEAQKAERTQLAGRKAELGAIAEGSLSEKERGERNRLQKQGDRAAKHLDGFYKDIEMRNAKAAADPETLAFAKQQHTKLEGEQKKFEEARQKRIAGELKAKFGQMVNVVNVATVNFKDFGIKEYTDDELEHKKGLEAALGRSSDQIASMEANMPVRDRHAEVAAVGDRSARKALGLGPGAELPKSTRFLEVRSEAAADTAARIEKAEQNGVQIGDAVKVDFYSNALAMEGDLARSKQTDVGIELTKKTTAQAKWQRLINDPERKKKYDELEKLYQKATDRTNARRREWEEKNEWARLNGKEGVRIPTNPIYVEHPPGYKENHIYEGNEKALLDDPKTDEWTKRDIQKRSAARVHKIRNEWAEKNRAAKEAGGEPVAYLGHEMRYIEKPDSYRLHQDWEKDQDLKKKRDEIQAELAPGTPAILENQKIHRESQSNAARAEHDAVGANDRAHAYGAKAEVSRQALIQAEKDEAVKEKRPVDEKKLEGLSLLGVKNHQTLVYNGTSINADQGSKDLAAAELIVLKELPDLDPTKHDEAARARRVELRVELQDGIASTAEWGISVAFRPPGSGLAPSGPDKVPNRVKAGYRFALVGKHANDGMVKDIAQKRELEAKLERPPDPNDDKRLARAETRGARYEKIMQGVKLPPGFTKNATALIDKGKQGEKDQNGKVVFKGFDQRYSKVRSDLHDRTDSAVSWTSNAVMFAVSGGDNMRQGVKDADDEALSWAKNAGERIHAGYKLGYETLDARLVGVTGPLGAEPLPDFALEFKGDPRVEAQWELLGFMADPRAERPGQRGAWREEFEGYARKHGMSIKEFEGITKIAETDPSIAAWRQSLNIDDLEGWGKLHNDDWAKQMFAPADETLYTTADILHKNHEELEADTKYLLLGIDAGLMLLGGELLAVTKVSGFIASATGLARASGAVAAAFGGGRIGAFMAGVFEGGAMLVVSKGAHEVAVAAGVKEGSGAMAFIDFASGAMSFNVSAKIAAFKGLGQKYAMNVALMGAPALAIDLGMDPKDAALLGDALMVFAPAFMGAMHADAKRLTEVGRAEYVVKSYAEMGAPLHADSQAKYLEIANDPRFAALHHEADLSAAGMKRRSADLDRRLETAGVPEADRQRIVDMDATKKAIEAAGPPPELRPNADEAQTKKWVGEVDQHYKKVEDRLVELGYKPDRARELVQASRKLAGEHAGREIESQRPPIPEVKTPRDAAGAHVARIDAVLAGVDPGSPPSGRPAAHADGSAAAPRVTQRDAASRLDEGMPQLGDGRTVEIDTTRGVAVITDRQGKSRSVQINVLLDEAPELVRGLEVTVGGKTYRVGNRGSDGRFALRDPASDQVVTHMGALELYRHGKSVIDTELTPPGVVVMRQDAAAGGRARDDHGYVLLRVEGDRAQVRGPKGTEWVARDQVIYDHSGLTLGADPPLVMRRHDARMKALAEPGREAERAQWDALMAEAKKKSPEHATFVRRLFAVGESADFVRKEFDAIKDVPPAKLGDRMSMKGLTQHLRDSCALTAKQWGLGARHPAYAKQIGVDVADQAKQQKRNLEAGGGASSARRDSAYVHGEANPLGAAGEAWKAAQPARSDGNWDTYDFRPADPARGFWPPDPGLAPQRAQQVIDAGGTVWVHVLDARTGQPHPIPLRKDAQNPASFMVGDPPKAVSVPRQNLASDGAQLFYNGLPVQQISLPRGQGMPELHRGMFLDDHPELFRDLEVVTGQRYERRGLTNVDENAFLDHITALVADGSPVPVAVQWTSPTATAVGGAHQLWVDKVRQKPGGSPDQLELLVYDPTHPEGRWIPREQLLYYNDGTPGVIGRPYMVFVPEHTSAFETTRPLQPGQGPMDPLEARPPKGGLGPVERRLAARPEALLGAEIMVEGTKYRVAELNPIDGSYVLMPKDGGDQALAMSRSQLAKLPAVEAHLKPAAASRAEQALAKKPDLLAKGFTVDLGKPYELASRSPDGESYVFVPKDKNGPAITLSRKQLAETREVQRQVSGGEPTPPRTQAPAADRVPPNLTGAELDFIGARVRVLGTDAEGRVRVQDPSGKELALDLGHLPELAGQLIGRDLAGGSFRVRDVMPNGDVVVVRLKNGAPIGTETVSGREFMKAHGAAFFSAEAKAPPPSGARPGAGGGSGPVIGMEVDFLGARVRVQGFVPDGRVRVVDSSGKAQVLELGHLPELGAALVGRTLAGGRARVQQVRPNGDVIVVNLKDGRPDSLYTHRGSDFLVMYGADLLPGAAVRPHPLKADAEAIISQVQDPHMRARWAATLARETDPARIAFFTEAARKGGFGGDVARYLLDTYPALDPRTLDPQILRYVLEAGDLHPPASPGKLAGLNAVEFYRQLQLASGDPTRQNVLLALTHSDDPALAQSVLGFTRGESNPARLRFLELALAKGPAATREALTTLADPSFVPEHVTVDPAPDRTALQHRAASLDPALKKDVEVFARGEKDTHKLRLLNDALDLGPEHGKAALKAFKEGFDPSKAAAEDFTRVFGKIKVNPHGLFGRFRDPVRLTPEQAGEALFAMHKLDGAERARMKQAFELLPSKDARAAFLQAMAKRADDLSMPPSTIFHQAALEDAALLAKAAAHLKPDELKRVAEQMYTLREAGYGELFTVLNERPAAAQIDGLKRLLGAKDGTALLAMAKQQVGEPVMRPPRPIGGAAGLEGMVDWAWANQAKISSFWDIYKGYNGVTEPNPLSKSREAFRAEAFSILEGRKPPASAYIQTREGFVDMTPTSQENGGFYHFYRDTPSNVKSRLYINAAADHAPELMKVLVQHVIDNPSQFPGVAGGKIAGEAGVDGRAENIVLYFKTPEDRARVITFIAEYQKAHPDHFKATSPAMTDPVLPGVSTASEPSPAAVQKGILAVQRAGIDEDGFSFGTHRSAAIFLALRDTKASGLQGDKAKAFFANQVKARFEEFGIDPRHPGEERHP